MPSERRKMSPVEKGLLGVRVGSSHTLLPGTLLAALLAWGSIELSGFLGTRVMGFEISPVSPVMVALLLGMLIGNIPGFPGLFQPGIDFALKKVLRLGIILLGVRLSIFEVLRLGLFAVPIVVICIVGAVLLTTGLNRLMGLPGRLGTLIAVGTSICGVSAIVSTGPVIEARDEEVTYAISVITIFGLAATLAYPYLAQLFFPADAVRAGLFLGTAVHDTSQVTGAALVYADVFSQPAALAVATTTKLVRNVFMTLVIPFMAYTYRRSSIRQGGQVPGRVRLLKLFPTFVLGFVALAVLRSAGDWSLSRSGRVFGLFGEGQWSGLVGFLSTWAVHFIIMALAGVGLGTRFAILKGLGLKPFLVGLGAALSVGAVSWAAIRLLGGLLGI